MSSFLENLALFCNFFIQQLTPIANFFMTNPIGLLVIGLSLFSIILGVVFKIFGIFHK